MASQDFLCCVFDVFSWHRLNLITPPQQQYSAIDVNGKQPDAKAYTRVANKPKTYSPPRVFSPRTDLLNLEHVKIVCERFIICKAHEAVDQLDLRTDVVDMFSV